LSDAHQHDLVYIQMTAWATVALVAATIFMIVWQIQSAKRVAKAQLTIDLMDRYDPQQVRVYRQTLASALLAGTPLPASVMEPVIDQLETIAALYESKWLDYDLVDNAFASQLRFWWAALEHHIRAMRVGFSNDSYYECFERLAMSYDAKEPVNARAQNNRERVALFLRTEAT